MRKESICLSVYSFVLNDCQRQSCIHGLLDKTKLDQAKLARDRSLDMYLYVGILSYFGTGQILVVEM